MSRPVPAILVVEDILSEMVLRKMLRSFQGKFSVHACLGKQGFGFIQKNLRAFNRAAAAAGFVVLTDLDDHLCPRLILKSWLPEQAHPNFVFRVAIHEVEAWLLAHREGFARYLGVSSHLIPLTSESVHDPKAMVIDLARRSTNAEIRDAIVPGTGRRRKVGPDYNGCLLRFVHEDWDIQQARNHSPSLHRALVALERFRFHGHG